MESAQTSPRGPYTVKILSKRVAAEDTLLFLIEKPKDFIFVSGQYCNLSIVHPVALDEKGMTRHLSIVSIPDDDELAFATRIRDSAFKKALAAIPEGGDVGLEGPFGSFGFHADVSVPAVFLVGGIGITPVMSMIRSALTSGQRYHITLFYSNKKKETTIFYDELKGLADDYPDFFMFVPTMTDDDREWKGEKGRITESMIAEHVPDVTTPMYYIVGSTGIVTAMRDILKGMAISDDKMRGEEFPGY